MNKLLNEYLLKSTALIGISTILSTITITIPRAEALGIVTTQPDQLFGNARPSNNARKSLETSKNIHKFREQVASKASLNSPDGSSCEGDVTVISFTGKAVCTYANGDRYEGEVVNAKPHGKGVMSFANGDRYEGEFQNGKLNGSGTYTFKNGDRRVGQWVLDEYASTANQSATNTPIANSANPTGASTPTSVALDLNRNSESSTSIQKTYSPASPIAQSDKKPENPSALKVSPLQKPPIRLFNLTTANQLEAGDLSLSIGTRFSSIENGIGSGLQTDYGYIDYGVTNDFQVGLSASLFDDLLGRKVNGNLANLVLNAFAPTVKYQVFKDENLQVAVAGSAEMLQLSTDGGLFGSSSGNYNNLFIGSLQVPVTYNATRDLQLHFTPGLAFFPSSVNGSDFYGTLFKIGTGLSWQATDRLRLFADVNVPLGGKGNAINASDGNFSQRIIYSGGLRYLVSPAVGVDLYATNGFSNTPATSFLAFIPDGNQLSIGANLTYTPNTGKNFAATFRKGKPVPLSSRDTQLSLDGFNLASADTLFPGLFHVWGGLGSGTNVNVAYGVTNDFQLELFGQQFNKNGDPTLIEANSKSGFKLGAATKVRFFDQVQGDPVSLGLKLAISFVQSFDAFSSGYFALEMPTSYSLNPQLSFKFNPKASFVSSNSQFGLGLGINYALLDDLQFIGEFTPLFKSNSDQGSVWSVGLRYFYPQTNVGVDVYLSNSIGQNGLGGLFAQSNGSSLGFNLHWLFGQ